MGERKKYYMDKTTKELLEAMKTSKNYYEYLENNRDSINSGKMKPGRALTVLLSDCGKKKAAVIARSNVEKHYAYQIFEDKKTPSRDKMIMLCIGMELSYEQTNTLFKVTGYSPLYAKDLRDNIIIYSLENKINVVDTNYLLDEKNLPILD